MNAVATEQVRDWLLQGGALAAVRQARVGIGERRQDIEYLAGLLGLPYSLLFAAWHLLQEEPGAADTALDSIPFYSLCRGFFLPLMGMPGERVGRLFGLKDPGALSPQERSRLVGDLLEKPLGLSLVHRVGLILGDPFLGRSPSVREDTLTRVLARLSFHPIKRVRHMIVQAGDLASLFAMRASLHRSDPALTAGEALTVLRFLRDASSQTERMDALCDLFLRCGRLEAYVLAALILNKVHLSLSGRNDLILEHLARHFGAPKELLGTVAALTDFFQLARILEHEGVEGLKKVALKPLSPILPALAGSTIPSELTYPVWFECKYDGIRVMLHKDHDERGQVQLAAFTRRRHDWVELIPGIQALGRMLPCRSVILDGELHGTTMDLSGIPRPCTVYETHQFLRGEGGAVNLRYTAFDILYLDGQDLTGRPFSERRSVLERLLAGLTGMPLPLPVEVSRGRRAASKEEMNRLYEQFRAQGYEGGMVKTESAPYPVAQRSPHWMKRKPEETLDLVLTGAFWSDPTTAGRRMFDSYLVSCREGTGFKEVGTVGGVDEVTTMKIARSILQYNLLTGRPIEHRGHQRTAAGLELAPYLVVTVALEAVVRDTDGVLSLRSPRLKEVRAGEMGVNEIATLQDLERRYQREGLA